MVQSKLDDSINYLEKTKINREIKKYYKKYYESNDGVTYDVEIFGKDVEITFGQPEYTYIDNGITYFPIYLVLNDVLDSQIGVYEVFSNTLPNILDSEGNLELESLENALFYSYSGEFLEEKLTSKEPTSKELTSKELTSKELTSKELTPKELTPKELTPKELTPKELTSKELTSKEQSSDEPNNEKDVIYKSWIQKYMNNKDYDIVDNEGGGDCLFAVIRDALKTANVYITVDKLRDQLAGEATEELYNNYKSLYDNMYVPYQTLYNEIRVLKARNKEIRKLLSQTQDRDEQKKLIKEASEMPKILEEKVEELKIAKELLDELEYIKIIKDVKDLDEFKKYIKSCKFWGDSWAIITLERALNVKLVLFSEEKYNDDDLENVLYCGDVADPILKQKGNFEPTHYILLDHNGYHYKLITYENRGAFTFKELPITIKENIANKCLEGNSGQFYLIPEFKKYNSDIIEEIDPSLYDEDIVFQIYANSAGKPLPGKGVGEKIDPKKITEFSKLSNNTDWRRKLTSLIDIKSKDKSVKTELFEQDPELKEILKQTKNAKIVLFSRGKPPIVLEELVKVRKSLLNKNK